MEEKKKFEKPSMDVIEMKPNVSILNGSCPGYCGEDGGFGG